jgi:hypothetical protein
MTKERCIEKKKNSKGVIFALITDGEKWSVWVLCENYDGRCHGGMRKTWRYVVKEQTEEDARKVFNRRTK